MTNWDEMVLIGHVARPHGLKGHVVVHPETDFPETRFAAGRQVWTRDAAGATSLVVASVRFQGTRPVVRFEGVDRIEDAQRIAGFELRIPESDLRTLDEGQYYEHQLAGCLVETMTGERLGEVVRVERGVGGSRLVVQTAHGEVLVPLAVSICPDVNIGERRIRIDPPAGLIELNASGKPARAGGRRRGR